MDRLGNAPRGRRGRRLPRCLPLMLHWREPQGSWREIPAVTKVLSKHGCLVGCAARIKPSDEVMVWWLEKMHYSPARVVFRAVSGDNSVDLAFEFLGGNGDFWGLDF